MPAYPPINNAVFQATLVQFLFNIWQIIELKFLLAISLICSGDDNDSFAFWTALFNFSFTFITWIVISECPIPVYTIS